MSSIDTKTEEQKADKPQQQGQQSDEEIIDAMAAAAALSIDVTTLNYSLMAPYLHRPKKIPRSRERIFTPSRNCFSKIKSGIRKRTANATQFSASRIITNY
jgi:hypothetical protein